MADPNKPIRPRVLTYTEMMNSGRKQLNWESYSRELELYERLEELERRVQHLEKVIQRQTRSGRIMD